MFEIERSLTNKGILDTDKAFYPETGMAWHATMSLKLVTTLRAST